MTFDQFEEFIMSSDCYWEHDVSYIDKEGLQHLISPFEFYQYQIQVAKLIADQDVTIKIEQMERHWKLSRSLNASLTSLVTCCCSQPG